MRRFVFIALALCVLAASALAQTTGRLVGTVSGPDGVIPGATVTVTDTQTGRERTVITSGDGAFALSQLEFGTYTVRITAQGFRTFTATDLKIDAGRDFTLNAPLEVGGVEEEVTVVAGADVLNASNAELSNTISPRQVRELPINGRNPLTLLNLIAGANATSFSINGMRSSSVNYTRDGLNVQDNFIRNGFVQDQPTVDDTGEFTVITQNAGAENGFGGTQVQLVTPRGGGDFHGNAYIFNRNSYFAANTFFNNRNNVDRPFLNRNQFGGTISGPSILPRFGEGGPSIIRQRAFFFVNYEGFRLAQQSPASATTLLPAARNGTFTYVDNTGTTRTVNVLTGAGLTSAIPATAGGALTVDPVIQNRILNNLPTSGNGITTGINLLQTVNLNRGNPETRNAVTGRFDVELTDRHAFNFVYKWNDILDARTDIASGFSTSTFVNQGGPTTLYVGSYRMTPTPSFTNEIRGGYQRSEPFFFESNVPRDFILSLPLITNPEGTFRDQGRNTDYWNIQNNASYAWGNHSFRFGAQGNWYMIEALNFAGTTPTYSISGAGNVNSPTLAPGLFPGGINSTDLGRANSLRFLLGGLVTGATVTSNVTSQTSGFVPGAPAIRTMNFENFAFYFGDQWRVTPNLTLNLGLRYELYTPVNDPRGLYLEAVVPEGGDPVQAALNPNGIYDFVGRSAGNPGDWFKMDTNNFGPNISFAWSPQFENGVLSSIFPGNGRTVIRGGFRIGYVNDEYVRAPENALINHIGLGSTTVSALNPATNTAALRSRLTPEGSYGAVPGFGIPAFTPPPRTYLQNSGPAQQFFGTAFVIDPNMQVPRQYEYNFGIQREIANQTALEIRYVGARSDQLVRSVDHNQLDIRSTGFLADFLRAQNNCRAQGATIAGTGDPLFRCTSAAFNPAITGSQPLQVFPTMPGGGFLTDPTILGLIRAGTPGEAALIYIINNLAGPVQFRANPNTGVANVLGNYGLFRYNALQVELRRRFSAGLQFQANYTFQKILADTSTDTNSGGQARVDAYLDNLNPRLDYARPEYDRAHTFNGNMIYELPFGSGRRWLNERGWQDRIFGGFQFSSIVNLSTGEPVYIRDPRGTLNRTGRSSRQPANSTLTGDEIKDLVGIFRTPDGIFLINPSVLQITRNAAGVVTAVRGASPLGTAPFPGQVFFHVPAGETGNLPRTFLNGPFYANWDAGLLKNVNLTETTRIQLRMEVFNVLNRANFFIGENSGIFDVNSTSFGRVTSTYPPRIMQFGLRFEF